MTNDNATLAASAVMAILGVPWLLLVLPIVIQVLAGDWGASSSLVEQGLHWGGFIIGALIALILIVGAILE